MTIPSTEFYSFPEFKIGQEKKLLLVQVDIEGHSKLSKENNADEVMLLKIKLADELAKSLGAYGFKGMGWQGDGGMFALEVGSNNKQLDKTALSWRSIKHAAKFISNEHSKLLKGEIIPLRASAHVCYVRVHPDPRYWHSEGINEFAKAERILGICDAFVITGELYRELLEQAREEFEELPKTVTVGNQSEIYKYVGEQSGDGNMSFNRKEMILIEHEVKSFRATLRNRPVYNDIQAEQPILIVVDLQKDFGSTGNLAVPDAEQIATKIYTLVNTALQANIAVVVTRDWHEEGHFASKTWLKHCVQNSHGAEFIDEFDYESLKEHVLLADIGADNSVPDYNPFFDQKLEDFLAKRSPKKIFVVGIALEYCVLATGLAALAYSKKVVALEDYIRSAKAKEADFAWDILTSAGVLREKGIPF